jgi:Tfp pilus assembly protein PilX
MENGQHIQGTAALNRSGRESGVALVVALIVVTVVLLLVVSTMYVVTSSTTMSGVGKKYATASEAADGGVMLTEEAITVIRELRPDNLPTLIPGTCNGQTYTLKDTVGTVNLLCEYNITLPGTLGNAYDTTIKLQLLGGIGTAGSRIEFPPRYTAGMSGVAYFYKIDVIVRNKADNTTAENSVLYRAM